jgi:hypothetical protein
MSPRIAPSSLRLALLALLTFVAASCGGDDAPPIDADLGVLPDAAPQDAGDAGPRDAAEPDAFMCPDLDGDGHAEITCGGDDCDDDDSARYPGNTEVCDAAGHDEDCDDTTFGIDGDGDDFVSTACCNTQTDGTLACGTDCDDADSTVHPGVSETCDSVDNNCNGTVDEGVCVPCATGYTGFDGTCTDIDECLLATTCGGGRAGCVNEVGSYVCACATGYEAPLRGGTCTDIDECATTAPCGVLGTSCVNTFGSYACSCLLNYGAPTTGGTCADLDECALGTCGAVGVVTSCVNSVGSYACTCAAGYTAPASGAPCVDINECTLGTCGFAWSVASCANSAGSYACRCYGGYAAPATGGTCADLDECTLGTDDCDDDPAAICANTPGSFTCACPASFAPSATTGHGAGGCLLSDPSLSSLVPSTGALSPAFDGSTTTYTLTLPPGATSLTFTPSVAYPAHATMTVDGVIVASGAASAPISLLGFAPRPLAVTVTTESGATRTYTVVVGRSSAYVKASNTEATDWFGYSVSLSSDGTRLVVGAHNEDSSATGVGGNHANNTAVNSGAVYVFSRSGSTWTQEAYVKASNTEANDWFGYSVSLSADGTRLAVGAHYEDSSATGVGGNQADNTASSSGAVYVFSRTGTTWTQEAYVKASNTGANDTFGWSVSLSSDGTRLAVGANWEDSSATDISGNEADNSALNSGAVYVFSRTGTTWTQEAYVKASNTDANDWFGYAVSLSADGTRLAVGAWYENSSATSVGGNQADNTASGSGAAYVFSRTGTTWTQEAYVKASNTGAGDFFGVSVSLSADGTRLAVGAYGEDSSATDVGGNQANNGASWSGAAYVFSRAGTAWTQEAYVKASNTGTSDDFGVSVSLSSDGTRLAVSAYYEDSSATGVGGNQADNTALSSGAVYVFSRTGTTWTQEAYVKASNTEAGDDFGWSVSLSSDGTRLAVGAYGEASSATGVAGNQADNGAGMSGAVYVY